MIRKPDVPIGRRSLRLFGRAVALFMRSPVGLQAKLWAVGLLLLILGLNGMNVLNSYVLRDLMSSIEGKDFGGFRHYAWMYAGVFAVSTLFGGLYQFSEERLGLLWRDWMTRNLTGLYIDGRIYLLLQTEQSLTNPDQRISEDVKSLTVSTLSFVLMIINSTVTAISFSGVLWAISPPLFLVAVAYALVGSGLTILLGKPLVRLNYRQADFEADFRADLVRVRQVADGIALAGYEGRVRSRLMQRVDLLVQNFRWIVAVNRNLRFFTSGYNYLIQLIPLLLVAPLFMRGDADFGIIGQSAMAFSTLVAAFSLIVTQFQSISSYASVATRLTEFAEAANRTAHRKDTPCIDCTSVTDHFAFRNLTLRSAREDRRILVEDLNARIKKGCRTIIWGQAHAAKQSIFRACAGLHVTGSGCIDRPPPDKTAFIPENPFLPAGKLREVLILPQYDREINDEEIHAVLEEVGLTSILEKHDGIDSVRNWHDVLSLRQEQLMAVARAILAHPDFVFLDHLNSALGDVAEQEILKLMIRRGITCVSVGNGPPDPELHDAALELREDGSWEWTDLHQCGR